MIMRKNTSAYRFVEWSSPEELHQDALQWISDLEFIKDEQQFLNSLIKNHTLELISGEIYNQSKKLVNVLSKEETEVTSLLEAVRRHSNQLEILADGVNQLQEERKYKEAHYILKIDVSRYEDSFKKTKSQIFLLIAKLMKQKKQKRLS
jgi:hypothetical protein